MSEPTSPAQQQAHDAVLFDIENEAWSIDFEGQKWWDVRPMVDPNEHSPPVIDQAVLALAYAHRVGLITAHPQHAHLVRITTRGPAA